MGHNPYKRNDAIDFTKGFLVIVMVAHHLLNYFFQGKPILFMYVNYATGAFIFISGVICGALYFNKYLDDKRYVRKRLITRGLKLIISACPKIHGCEPSLREVRNE